MSLAKVLVVVDHWVNVRNPQEAWWVALNNIDPERDARFTMGPVDVLDHSSRAFTYGSKMGLDATRKFPEEGFTREWPDVIEMDDATKRKVDAMWKSLGIPEAAAIERVTAPLEGQTFAHRGSRWLVYANFVKLPHTLFALPFALVGVVLASYHAPVSWSSRIGWIVLAFTCARFAAMGFNRIVDREIDARNPRTRQREIPSGVLRVDRGRDGRDDRVGRFRVRGVASQSAVRDAVPDRAGVGVLLQLHQAVHTVVPRRTRRRHVDRAGRRIPRSDRGSGVIRGGC